ncbi:thioredoxin reductase [archaeon]|nr:thioredoxin reductase [archaeon]
MYDLIIIGAGSGGLSAAVYARRFLMKTLVIGELMGGLLTTTHLVENWPGEKSISGTELMNKLEAHARSLGAEMINDKVTSVEKKKEGYLIRTSDKEYKAKSLIISTGTVHRELGVKGCKKYANRGVSYCAACDAAFFKNKVVGVVGGGDSAAKESLLLTEYAKKVYIINRDDDLTAEPINLQRVNEKISEGAIKLVSNAEVKEVKGDGEKVTGVLLDNGKKLLLDGLFIEIGSTPQTSLAESIGVELNDKGEIIIDKLSRTSVEGVFAAGDCVNHPYKQAIIASGQGVNASFSAYDYLNRK